MKNGEAILNAAKTLGRELSIGLKAEYEVLKEKAGKVSAEYKEGTLGETIKQQVEKNLSVAGEVISAQKENISKEIRKAKEQAELKRQAKETVIIDAEAAEEPAEAAENEETVCEDVTCEACCEETPAEDACEECCEEVHTECCEEAPAAEEAVEENN